MASFSQMQLFPDTASASPFLRLHSQGDGLPKLFLLNVSARDPNPGLQGSTLAMELSLQTLKTLELFKKLIIL